MLKIDNFFKNIETVLIQSDSLRTMFPSKYFKVNGKWVREKNYIEGKIDYVEGDKVLSLIYCPECGNELKNSKPNSFVSEMTYKYKKFWMYKCNHCQKELTLLDNKIKVDISTLV